MTSPVRHTPSRRPSAILLVSLLIGLLVWAIGSAGPASAQISALSSPVSGRLLQSEVGILNNSIANLHVKGDSVWVGPYLNLSVDGGTSWYAPETDSLFGSSNRLYSIDVKGDLVVAGLGRTDNVGGEGIQTAAGFLVSEDGGSTFAYRFPQLDDPGKNTIQYGVSTLPAIPIIVPQQSPPFDVDFDPEHGELWVAGWASGIRRSTDLGRTWERVVMPPDNLDFITPTESYSFTVEPQRGSSGELNHMGFSVLVDESGTIWAGTAGGVNRSMDGGYTWQRFKTDGTGASLTGNWVISIEEQPHVSGRSIWMATWNTGDVGGGGGGQFGVTVTHDGGETFSQALLGERIYDFAFDGEVVYAAGDNGLFVSDDGGRSWTSFRDFPDSVDSRRLVRPGAAVYTVGFDHDVLWVGTADGLLKSLNGGLSWRIYRTEVPVHPDEATTAVPDVNVFAYPNPFSPGADRFIRIRYELDTAHDVRIRVFDYGMNIVREITDSAPAGTSESVWDGTDSGGARVANGAYFYEVTAGDARFRGKILVIE